MLDSVLVELTGATKMYPGGLAVLDQVTLSLSSDERVAMVGPSGCGKSTLMRCLLGLEPFQGKALSWYISKSECCVLFQDLNLIPWLTVSENINLHARLTHGALDESILNELTGELDLRGFLGRYPHELSGGMRQMVSLLRALVSNPKLLLLDETLSNVDDLTRHYLCGVLRRRSVQLHQGMLCITHDISDALFLADRILIATSRPMTIASVFDSRLPSARGSSIRFDPAFQSELARLQECVRSALS